jgi:hypothetical protein
MPTAPQFDDSLSIDGLKLIRRQWQALTALVGPVLVRAGPGSGNHVFVDEFGS